MKTRAESSGILALVVGALLATACDVPPDPAISMPKYLGYFANNVHDSFAENFDHVNLHHIVPFGYSGDAATQYSIVELEKVKAHGARALLTVVDYLFEQNGNTLTFKSTAESDFARMINTMVNNGYIIPGDPEHSLVAGFYVVDEPELYGLGDDNSAANVDLVKAVNVINNNPATAGFPKVSIMGNDFDKDTNGIRLFDWVGFDCYGCKNYWSLSSSKYKAFKKLIDTSRQKVVLVPQSAVGSEIDNEADDPDQVFNLAKADASVILIMPFVWWDGEGHDWIGARSVPSLRTGYTDMGKQIMAAGAP